MKKKVLLIYTGGTIGMKKDYKSNSLQPFDFSHISNEIPELERIDCELHIEASSNPIDSSDMSVRIWKDLASTIEKNYSRFDGFVILHGSDTMAYTASMLSFMLENLGKPVILTGSQLPIGTLRTDGKENLITAIEIASAYRQDKAVVQEVAIYFEYSLYRGNRSVKIDAENFRAFESPNYPLLAEAGVEIKYNEEALHRVEEGMQFRVTGEIDTNVVILSLFPGIRRETIDSICGIKGLKGLVLESYGSGNVPSDPELIHSLSEAVKKGLTILNVSQCIGGSVRQGMYQNSRILNEIGAVSGGDMTTEAAVTKMMFLMGNSASQEEVISGLQRNLSGERSTHRD